MHPHKSTQPDMPQTLVGISFENSFRAQEFLVAATGLAAAGRLRLKDAVTVVKDDMGKTVVHETIDPTPGRAAVSGAGSKTRSRDTCRQPTATAEPSLEHPSWPPSRRPVP